MTFEYFTAIEIQGALEEAGYRSDIVIENGSTLIHSATFGAEWSVWLCNNGPFFSSMHLHTSIWVKEHPCQWSNEWNEKMFWSYATPTMNEGESAPTPDDDGDYQIFIAVSYNFAGGVTHDHLVHAFKNWTSTIQQLAFDDTILTFRGRYRN